MPADTRISVIIPAHNAAPYLASAIESILAQTLPATDIWIVDDGSSDATAAVAQSFGDKIKFIQHETAQGSAGARNAALHAARGELIAFLDADDIAHPERLALQTAQLVKRPDAALSFCGMEYIDHQEHKIGDVISTGSHDESGFLGRMMVRNRIGSTSVVMARRQQLMAAGGFDEGLTHNEEYELWLKLASRAPVLAIDRPLIQYRLHPGNISRDRITQQRNEALVLGRYSTEKIAAAIQAAYHGELEQTLALARVYVRRNNHEMAETLLSQLLDGGMQDERVYFYLGNLALYRDAYPDARRWYTESLKIQPNLAPAINNLGLIEAKSGNIAKARQLFEQAKALKKNYMDASSNLATLQTDNGDSELKATLTLLRDVLKPEIHTAEGLGGR